jgi:hypothetical protein
MPIDKKAAYLAFLNDPDQPARQAELRTFFGPRADHFLKSYQQIRSAVVPNETGKKPSAFAGLPFEAAPFFVGACWFFYRKMWLYGTLLVVVSIGVGLLPIPRIGLPFAIAIAFASGRLYVWHAIITIQSFRQPDGTISEESLRTAGGVSILAGTISGIIYFLLIALALFAIIVAARAGQPIPR